MKALVLSGGSIKGAFQAGAIAAVLDQGFVPDAIYGTSVGSLNGAFLAERAGRAVAAKPPVPPDWPEIGKELERFWRERITSFSCIGKKRGWLKLGIAIARNRFDGMIDTSPLRKLVDATFDVANLQASPVKYYICSVNIASGVITYADPNTMRILDYVIASTAIPLIMPMSQIGDRPFWDGGIREVAPLKKPVDDGAEEIVCIACDPATVGGAKIDGSFMNQSSRLMEIVVGELLNDDIKLCRRVNFLIGQPGPYQKHKKVDLRVIQPSSPLVIDLQKFTPTDIASAIAAGRAAV